MPLDVSLILNAHREGALLAQALTSLKDASAFARANGISVELVLVLDTPDQATRDVVRRTRLSSFDSVQVAEIAVGSLGLARNEGCARASGTYVMLCDGDDLISFNGIEATVRMARTCRTDTVFFPRWTVGFGASTFFVEAQDLSLVSPLRFLKSHPYTSRACFRRDVMSDVTFQDLRLTRGYAYEDWLFNCELAARGFDFRTVDDVILFYRQTPRSLMSQIAAQSAKAIPPSSLFEPQTFLDVCATSVGDRQSLTIPFPGRQGRSFFSTSLYGLLSHAASSIEPALDPTTIGGSWETPIEGLDVRAGLAYYDICKLCVGRAFKCLFFLPERCSPADIALLNTCAEILGARAVAALTFSSARGATSEIHQDIAILRIAPDDALDEDGHSAIAIKVIQSCCPAAALHILSDANTLRFFAKYGHLFQANRKILYVDEGAYVADGAFFRKHDACASFLSFNSDQIDLCVAGNRFESDALRDRLCLRTSPALLRRYRRPARSREEAIAQTGRGSRRVLCLSGALVGSRLDLVPKIASRLAKAAADVTLDVRGSAPDDAAKSADQTLPNVEYGPAIGCVSCLSQESFLCLIHLCWLDNCGPTILDAAGMGVPNIAPDVGSVGEFIRNGETGLLIEPLLSEDAAADAYADAILQLASDATMRADVTERAYDKLETDYMGQAYDQAVRRIVDA